MLRSIGKQSGEPVESVLKICLTISPTKATLLVGIIRAPSNT